MCLAWKAMINRRRILANWILPSDLSTPVPFPNICFAVEAKTDRKVYR